jgi:hypothetical protein
MVRRIYYLIRPSQRLLDELFSVPEDARMLLNEPQLWARSEIDGKWKVEDEIAVVKLVFLADLLRRHRDDKEFYRVLSQLFDPEAIEISAFDKWWTIEPFPSAENFEEIVGLLKSSSTKIPTQTGHPLVNDWISSKLS